MIPLLITLALFPLVGIAAARLFRIALPSSRVARAASVFLLGIGMQGTLLYVLGALHVPLTRITFLVAPFLALAVLAVRRGDSRTLPIGGHDRHAGSAILFGIPLAAMLLATAVMPTRDYDGRVTWLPKARAIALEGAIDGPFFQGQRGLNLHNRYPLLVPLDVAAVMALSNDVRNEGGRWLYVLVAVSMLIVLRAFLRAWFGTTGAWVSVITAWLPLLLSIDGGALASYNDLTLAAFIGAAVLFVLEGEPAAAGLFAAFAILTKNEGAPLAAAFILAAIVGRRFRWRLLVPIVSAFLLVAYGRKLVPAAYDEQYDSLLSGLPRSIARLPEALEAIVRQASSFQEWGVFWIAVACAAIVCVIRARNQRIFVCLTLIAAGVAAYSAALTVTSWSIADLAPVAVNRLLSQLLVPAAIVVAAGVDALASARPSTEPAIAPAAL